jgi:hypothetical protein
MRVFEAGKTGVKPLVEIEAGQKVSAGDQAHERFVTMKAGCRGTAGRNCPGTFPPGPGWLFSRREIEFRQFSEWIDSIRPPNSRASGPSLRATFPPPSKNPDAAIGSNVFRQVKLKNQAAISLVRSEKQILFGRHRNQIAI